MPIPAIIAAVLSGTASAFAAAWLAKLLLPGEQRVGNAMLILIGSLAGLVTGVVVNLLNLGPEDGINWWSVAYCSCCVHDRYFLHQPMEEFENRGTEGTNENCIRTWQSCETRT